MKPPAELPVEIALLEDGHLTDLAATAMADGEAMLLPAAARAHAETCAQCTHAIGSAAMTSRLVGDALALAPRAGTRPEPTKARLPVAALVAACAIAMVGAARGAPAALDQLRAMREIAVQVAVSFLRASAAPGGVFGAAFVVSVGVLVGAGVIVARATPRAGVQEVQEGVAR